MPNPTSREPGTTNVGGGPHTAGRSHNPTVAYELAGVVRWVDAELDRIVVHVTEAGGRAGRWLGEDVTLDLSDSRRPDLDLLPGIAVRVRARLPRDLGASVPDPVPAVSIRLDG